MKLIECKSCGTQIAVTHTKKGKQVRAEIYWEGEIKIEIKNFQPVEHRCAKERKHR